MRVVSFRVYDELFKKLERYCRKTGMSRSEVVRIAVESYLRRRLKYL